MKNGALRLRRTVGGLFLDGNKKCLILLYRFNRRNVDFRLFDGNHYFLEAKSL